MAVQSMNVYRRPCSYATMECGVVAFLCCSKVFFVAHPLVERALLLQESGKEHRPLGCIALAVTTGGPSHATKLSVPAPAAALEPETPVNVCAGETTPMSV